MLFNEQQRASGTDISVGPQKNAALMTRITHTMLTMMNDDSSRASKTIVELVAAVAVVM